jgi:tetratricopeptide (TPR) repeat protein
MKTDKIFYRMSAMLAVMILTALNAFALETKAGGKITWTTKSEEAKENVAKAIQAIESFQFGPQVQVFAKKAIEADPEFAFAHYLMGATTFPPPDAKPHIDKAMELSKKASDGERRYLEAVILIRTQKPAEGLQILQALSKEYPEERMVQMMLGQVNMNGGKFDEAITHFEKAIQLDGSTPRAYGFIGNCHLLKADFAKAREMYQISLSKKASGTAPFLPYYGTVYTYVYEGNLEAALKVLYSYQDEYTKTGGIPNLPAVFIWNSIARLLLENGRPEEAIKAYERGYETVPGSSLSDLDKKIWLGRLHHGRGRSLSKLGKHEEAWKEAELIKKMIEEGGEQGKQFVPSYHYIAGYLKLESGKYAEAIEHLKQADQTDPFHKLLLARAYDKAGDQANAQKVYKEIVDSTQNSLERAIAYPEAKKKLKG